VIAGLMERLSPPGYEVKRRHLKPQLAMPRLRDNPNSIVVDPHGKPPRGVFLSLVKILVWLLEEWYARFFIEKRRTILICDRYYHDLLVDPIRYRFGAPMWTARLIGCLMPRPTLWILLNAPVDALRARKQEVTPEETARQCDAYLAFIHKQRAYVIVDASQSLDNVIADADRAVRMKMLSGRGNRG